MRILLLLALLALATFSGCACAPLGPRTLDTGEDKYSAKYD